ncbi:MAG: ThuA domain-containing protein [Bacteroidota bacterium]
MIVTDDRKFNREAFFGLFDSFQNIRSTKISHPEILDLFGTDSIRSFDAIVFYDMPEQVILTDIQKQNFLKFFEEGAPAIFLHHSLLSYRQWEQFTEIIGGRYYNKSPLITEQGDTLQSVYQHDVRYKVNIVDAEHPITLGMEDFEILDEAYSQYYVKDDVEVLLTTNHPLSGHKLGWINAFGNSRIVFLINGHGETAYENPNFQKLLYNAIYWAALQKEQGFPDRMKE